MTIKLPTAISLCTNAPRINMSSALFNLKTIFSSAYWKSENSLDLFHRLTEGRRVHSVGEKRKKKLKLNGQHPRSTSPHTLLILSKKDDSLEQQKREVHPIIRGSQTAKRCRGRCESRLRSPWCHHVPGAPTKLRMWVSQRRTVDKVLKSISVSDKRRWVSIPATLCSIFEILSVPLRLGEGRFGAGSNRKGGIYWVTV